MALDTYAIDSMGEIIRNSFAPIIEQMSFNILEIGNMSREIKDREKFLNIEIEEEDVDTLGGYLIKKLDRIPKDGEKPIVETEKVTYKIEKVKDRQIIKVKACKNF